MNSEFMISQLDAVTEEILTVLNTLLIQLNPDLPELTGSDLEKILATNSTYLYVLKQHDTIVGMLTFVVYRTPSGARGYIEDVVVNEQQRGKGLGKMLLHHAIEKAKELQLEYIGLTSRPEREAANKLYQSLGFKKRDTNVYRYIV